MLLAAMVLLWMVAHPSSARAQDAAPSQASAQAAIPQEKLDSLLAPIALYPDELLAQALMASTYPLDVVEAARFVKANRELKGDALDKEVLKKNWDPSVQSLTAFPQVLEMMDDKIEWTQELGDAFLSDKQRVMQTVQSLRQKADASGNLQSNEQQKVVKEQTTIIIEPAQPEVVYVPTYNPTVVYGSWWAPMYPPYYWPPPRLLLSGWCARRRHDRLRHRLGDRQQPLGLGRRRLGSWRHQYRYRPEQHLHQQQQGLQEQGQQRQVGTQPVAAQGCLISRQRHPRALPEVRSGCGGIAPRCARLRLCRDTGCTAWRG
jgi:hypothetical protein